MTPRKGKEERQGVLKGHIRAGRIYHPPLSAITDVKLSDWVSDDLPDLLWPLLLAAQYGDASLSRFRRLQQVALQAIGDDVLDSTRAGFDGRLTSLERVPVDLRPHVLGAIDESGVFPDVFPHEVLAVMRLYKGLPGYWLLVDPWQDVDTGLDETGAANHLLRAMVKVVGDRHLNAVTKCAPFGWSVLRGKVSMPADEVEILIDYPLNEEKRPLADATILSSFLAFKGWDEENVSASRAWARSFWAQNWRGLPCLLESDLEEDTVDPEPTDDDPDADDIEEVDIDAIVAGSLDETASIFTGFVNDALSRNSDIDLHDPAEHEVICGLVSRSARTVMAILNAPHMWNGEHGMNMMRALVETQIVLAWMRTQDDEIYTQYQNYGRGKAKLMKRHLEMLIEGGVDKTEPFAAQAVKHFEKRFPGVTGDAFQEVSVESTFAGVTLRKMAADAGLIDLYNHVYQSASGVAHGEWWAVEDYAMERCQNPLHLFHQIPSFDPYFPITPEFGPLLVRMLEDVIESARESLALADDHENEEAPPSEDS